MVRKRYPAIGRQMLTARTALGLTQADVAERMGLKSPQISRWETGDRIPNGRQIPALCDALGVSADWLLMGRGPMRYEPDAAMERLEIIRHLLNS